MCVCVCVRARARVRACVRACVRAVTAVLRVHIAALLRVTGWGWGGVCGVCGVGCVGVCVWGARLADVLAGAQLPLRVAAGGRGHQQQHIRQ